MSQQDQYSPRHPELAIPGAIVGGLVGMWGMKLASLVAAPVLSAILPISVSQESVANAMIIAGGLLGGTAGVVMGWKGPPPQPPKN